MNRYSEISITNRFDGKRVYKSTLYPTIEESDSDVYIISNDTDYLDTLANKYYSDPSLWWIIALANNIGKGRLSVESGLQLRIPTNIGKILSEFNKLNSNNN